MKYKNYFLTIIAGLALSTLITSCYDGRTQSAEKNAEHIELDSESEVLRGKYLVKIMGCNDCHSPKRMGANGPEIIPELLLSGYPSDRPIEKFDGDLTKKGFSIFYPDLTAAAGPWGVSFAANLTPDPTGIGNWSEEQFKTALTKGKFKGLENARMLLPPMPWTSFTEMTDADVSAVFKYLKSINPVSNAVPSPISADNM